LLLSWLDAWVCCCRRVFVNAWWGCRGRHGHGRRVVVVVGGWWWWLLFDVWHLGGGGVVVLVVKVVVRRVRWLKVKVVVDQQSGPTLSQTRHPPKRGREHCG